MDTEQDIVCPPAVFADNEEDAVFRPPLKGVRKRIDTNPAPGKRSVGTGLCDTPEYKRITEMITELVDIRARLDERGNYRDGDFKSSFAASSLIQALNPQASHAANVMEIGKKKKKKKKKNQRSQAGGTDIKGTPMLKLESTRRANRNAATDKSSLHPNARDRRGSTSRPPL